MRHRHVPVLLCEVAVDPFEVAHVAVKTSFGSRVLCDSAGEQVTWIVSTRPGFPTCLYCVARSISGCGGRI